MCNYETMNYDREVIDTTHASNGKNHSCGTVLQQISTVEVLGNKNGVVLKKVTTIKTVRFELYMDGDLLNRFSNQKTAQAMFKDFSA